MPSLQELTHLKKKGNSLSTEYIKKNINEALRSVENILKFLKEDYEVSINKVAEEIIAK